MIATQTEVTELTDITIRRISVSDMDNNVYLLTSKAEGTQVLIDAADNARAIAGMVAAGSGDCSDWANLQLIVTTHSHWDHVRALEETAAAFSATTQAGEDDADALPLAPDVRLQHGDTVTFGDITLDVIHLRGHTPGSVALAYDDPEGHVHLFTGDSLFPGGVGNTKNPGQSFESLYADVTERVFDVYDDATWVYPGHGSDTTLGAERPHLAEWRERGW